MSAEERDQRRRFLRSVELFASLEADALEAVLESMDEVVLPTSAVLFRQGDTPDGLYVLQHGRLAVLAEQDGAPRSIASIVPGQCVGETALLLSTERTATVQAEEPSRLLRLPVERFRRALEANEGLSRMVRALFERRLPWFRAVTTDAFGGLPEDLRLGMESALSLVRLPRHAVLFRRGDPADALYVILQGRLQAIREREEGEPEVIREMERGEIVGEVALLTGDVRTLTVRGARDTDLIRLTAEAFESVVARNPRVLRPVVHILARRLRARTPEAAKAGRTRTLAVLPLGPDVPLEGLLPSLVDGLAEAGTVLTLDAARFDSFLGAGASTTPSDHPRSFHLAEWLHGAEASHDTLVYVCDPRPTLWSERCLRQADRVLIVARAREPPSLGAQERLQTAMPLARDLVLLHPDGERRPSGTLAWLAAVGADRHHHVRPDRPQDARRLARFLSGRAVGLVLGGGGARGFAHAGVLHALAECGIPVDYVGGVSMGAVAAAAHAMGWDHEGVALAFRRAFVDTLPWRYSWPVISVFSPVKGDRALRRIFGDTQIEDLWTSCFCVAANITRGETKVFRRGPLWRAVRASGSFPGLVPPVPEQGEVLVDGGVLNNLPVEVMQRLCPGPVIACDVARDVELQVDPALTLCPSVARVLWSWLGPPHRRIQFPGIAAVVLRSVECREVAEKHARRRAAALYLAPPVASFGLTDVRALEAIAAAGYRDALERLRELPASFPRDRATAARGGS